MTKNKLFAWAITLLCFSLTSCSDEKDGPSKKILVTNAGVTEANQTVKPGDIVFMVMVFRKATRWTLTFVGILENPCSRKDILDLSVRRL